MRGVRSSSFAFSVVASAKHGSAFHTEPPWDNGPELILGAFSDAFDMRRLEAMVRASVSGQRFRRL